jgi:hypothetical protein
LAHELKDEAEKREAERLKAEAEKEAEDANVSLERYFRATADHNPFRMVST